MRAPILILSGAGVAFSGFRLGPLDLTVAPGERVALVGANGAGKSTALSAVAGRLDGYQGSIAVCGVEVQGDRTGTRGRVGVLPERGLGLPWMTGARHLDFLASFYPAWDPTYAGELARILEVPLDKPLGHLSRGNRVKLALVTAEAFRPPLLLLDEPTSGIDPVMRDRLLDLVGQVLPAGGDRALVFSTHILEDVAAVAERVVLLRDGRLVGDHSVDELLREGQGASLPVLIRRRLSHA